VLRGYVPVCRIHVNARTFTWSVHDACANPQSVSGRGFVLTHTYASRKTRRSPREPRAAPLSAHVMEDIVYFYC